jgi:hypothetical protein
MFEKLRRTTDKKSVVQLATVDSYCCAGNSVTVNPASQSSCISPSMVTRH